ncbi:hypothetical protein CHARACLAT_028094 [Characodon lateralis]|uniref:Uncharacterized protein n=1 Tax=Characodon lateralis TaxID=208331 RepID=A0ABU7F745_9TELE|nr:hypothetical protein [Characodon lateralis]
MDQSELSALHTAPGPPIGSHIQEVHLTGCCWNKVQLPDNDITALQHSVMLLPVSQYGEVSSCSWQSVMSLQFNSVYLYSSNSQHTSSQGSSQSQVHTFILIVTIEQCSQIQLFIQIG